MRYFVGIENGDWEVILKKLQQQLKGTPYQLKNFTTYKDQKGLLFIRFAKSITGWRRIFLRQQVLDCPIENLDQAHQLFLGQLQFSETDLTKDTGAIWRLLPVSERPVFHLP